MSHAGHIVRELLAIALASLSTGCALSEGDPYGVVDATLDARLVPAPERDRGAGFEVTSADYEVRFDGLFLEVDSITLMQTAGGGMAAFDPANPPEGYSLCHDGHCHSESGALVDYETIAAELALGGEGATSLVLQGGVVDLRAAAPLAFACEGPCILGAGKVVLLRLRLHELRLEGEVRDGREGAAVRLEGTHRFEGAIHLDDTPAGLREVAIELTFDDEAPPRVQLALSLPLTTAILDGIAFAELAPDNPDLAISLDGAPATAATAAMAGNLAAAPLSVAVERHDL